MPAPWSLCQRRPQCSPLRIYWWAWPNGAPADRGVTVASVLVDSVFVPASQDGGLWPCPGGPEVTDSGEEAVRLLAWQDLQNLLKPFDRLSPDGHPLWKLGEHGTTGLELQSVMYGSNRYVIFDPAIAEVVHNSESYLGGVLVDPSGYGDDERLVDGRRRWVCEALGAIVAGRDLPAWCGRPAVSQWAASNPALLRQLARLPGMSPAIPFTRFLIAHPAPSGGTGRFGSREKDHGDDPVATLRDASPIAAFDPDPDHWAGLAWHRRDGARVYLSWGGEHDDGDYLPATVANVIVRTWRAAHEVARGQLHDGVTQWT